MNQAIWYFSDPRYFYDTNVYCIVINFALYINIYACVRKNQSGKCLSRKHFFRLHYYPNIHQRVVCFINFDVFVGGAGKAAKAAQERRETRKKLENVRCQNNEGGLVKCVLAWVLCVCLKCFWLAKSKRRCTSVIGTNTQISCLSNKLHVPPFHVLLHSHIYIYDLKFFTDRLHTYDL